MASVLLVSDNSTRSRVIADLIRNRLHYPLHALPMNALKSVSNGELGAFSIVIVDVSPSAIQSLAEDIFALRKYSRNIGVLVLYPFGDTETESLVADAGVDDMLARPVTFERLKFTIQNLLRLQRLQWLLHAQETGQIPQELELHAHYVPLLNEKSEVRKFRDVEADAIIHALSHCRGQVAKAARALGVGRSTLYRKIDELNLQATDVTKAGQDASYSSRANHTTRPIMRVSATARS